MANDTPKLCGNGCGFYGTSAAMNLCSQCFRDVAKETSFRANTDDKIVESNLYLLPRLKPVLAPRPPIEESPTQKRCTTCRKKLGLLGFKCMCGDWCCASHRYPEAHGCFSHYKESGPHALARANPLIVADKLQNRI